MRELSGPLTTSHFTILPSTDAQLTQDLEMALKVLPDLPTADDENEFTEIEDYVPVDI